MKYIENWDKKNLRCHFCGSTQSVKYEQEILDPVISDKPTKVYVCNKCALNDRHFIELPTLKVVKTCHNTVNVIIQNCSVNALDLLWHFDLWHCYGEVKKNQRNNQKEIWFECDIEFLNFIKSDMGRHVFRHAGVEILEIEIGKYEHEKFRI